MASKEIYMAIVSRNNDPEKLGRVRVRCGALTREDVELPYWVRPIVPISGQGYGWFNVPAVGDTVEIEVTISDPSDETYAESWLITPDMRYRAAIYESPRNPPPSELTTNYPNRRGFKTKAGHLLIFDDADGKETVLIQGNFGNATPTTITLTEGSIKIENVDAHLEAKVKSVDLVDGADQHMVRGEDLRDWLIGHTHPTPIGPSGTPVQPFTPTILSSWAKVK